MRRQPARQTRTVCEPAPPTVLCSHPTKGLCQVGVNARGTVRATTVSADGCAALRRSVGGSIPPEKRFHFGFGDVGEFLVVLTDGAKVRGHAENHHFVRDRFGARESMSRRHRGRGATSFGAACLALLLRVYVNASNSSWRSCAIAGHHRTPARARARLLSTGAQNCGDVAANCARRVRPGSADGSLSVAGDRCVKRGVSGATP